MPESEPTHSCIANSVIIDYDKTSLWEGGFSLSMPEATKRGRLWTRYQCKICHRVQTVCTNNPGPEDERG